MERCPRCGEPMNGSVSIGLNHGRMSPAVCLRCFDSAMEKVPEMVRAKMKGGSMIHARGRIAGQKLKIEVMKDKGRVIHVQTFWILSVQVPADLMDANATAEWARGGEVDFTVEPIQIKMVLDEKEREARAAESDADPGNRIHMAESVGAKSGRRRAARG